MVTVRMSTKYIKKTGTTVLEKIAKLNKVMTGPEAVYRELNQEEDPSQRPRNTKQIKNKKYFESQKENTKNQAGASMYKKNLADNVQILENMVHSHPLSSRSSIIKMRHQLQLCIPQTK